MKTGALVSLFLSVVMLFVLAAFAKAQPDKTTATAAAATQSSLPQAAPAPHSASRYRPNHLPRRAQLFYNLDWGVDSLNVKSVESGELIRFSYRVVDADKATLLNDGKVEPFLLGDRSRVKLTIPSLEKVGQLRNKNAPEAGRSYWMAFSNKGGYVRKGDRVSVVIGSFRASGLIVQ